MSETEHTKQHMRSQRPWDRFLWQAAQAVVRLGPSGVREAAGVHS